MLRINEPVQRARYMSLETIAPLSNDPSSAYPSWQHDIAANAAQEHRS
jgi:hypothetical protein